MKTVNQVDQVNDILNSLCKKIKKNSHSPIPKERKKEKKLKQSILNLYTVNPKNIRLKEKTFTIPKTN